MRFFRKCSMFCRSIPLRMSALIFQTWLCLKMFLFFLIWIMKYEIWSSCACRYCSFSTPRVTYWLSFTWKFFFQLSDMVWSWNFSWRYLLPNEFGGWSHQFDHTTLSQNDFWFVNYTVCTCPKWWCHLSSFFVKS